MLSHLQVGMVRLLFPVFLIGVAISFDRASSEPVGPALEIDNFYFGACALPRDPVSGGGTEDLWGITCLNANVGAEVAFASGSPKSNLWIKHGRGYLGFHLNHLFSYHLRGYVRESQPLGDDVDESQKIHTALNAIRIGNPVLHKWRLTAGSVQLPFGIDLTGTTQFYQSFENRGFWASPPQSMIISYDDFNYFQAEIGYGSSRFRQRYARADRVEVPDQDAVSGKIMYDFSALDGSRVVISTHQDLTIGTRKMGLGFINTSRKGDITLLEFVRTNFGLDGSGDGDQFMQLIRFGYISIWRGNSRWVVQIDDERLAKRMGTLTYDIKNWGYVVFRNSIIYYRSASDDRFRRWYFNSGIEFEF
jgi:hypothetical protein